MPAAAIAGPGPPSLPSATAAAISVGTVTFGNSGRGSSAHSECRICRWCSRVSRATACPSASSVRLASCAVDALRREVGEPAAEPVRQLGERQALRHLRRELGPALLEGRVALAQPDPAAVDQRQARDAAVLRGEGEDDVAAPGLPRDDRLAVADQAELAAQRRQVGRALCGRVAVVDLLGAAVPALVDGHDLVPGRGQPRPTPSQSRALDDRPCTSRNGAGPAPSARRKRRAAARQAAGPRRRTASRCSRRSTLGVEGGTHRADACPPPISGASASSASTGSSTPSARSAATITGGRARCPPSSILSATARPSGSAAA